MSKRSSESSTAAKKRGDLQEIEGSSVHDQNCSQKSVACLLSPWKNPRVIPYAILAMAAMNVIFLGGKRRAFGMFVAELHVAFNKTSLTELDYIGCSYAAVGYMTTTISSAIILYFNRRYALFQFIGSCFILTSCLTSSIVPNPDWLFLTHTLLHGCGSSLVLSVVGLVVNEHFPKDHKFRVMATTMVSGGSVASIVFVMFYAWLIQYYNWRNALIVLGILYFIANNMGTVVFKKNEEIEHYEEQAKCGSNCTQYVTKKLVPILIMWTFDRIVTSVVTYGMLLNLGDYQRRYSSTLIGASSLTTLYAAGEASTYLLGAIIGGCTKRLLYNRLKWILIVTSLSMGITLTVWNYVDHSNPVVYFLAFLGGFSLGPSVTFLFPAGEEFTTLPGHISYPFTLCGMGCGMLLSPLLTATIAQATDYKYFFLIQGILAFMKFIVDCLMVFLLRRWDLKPMEEFHGGSVSSKSVNDGLDSPRRLSTDGEEKDPILDKNNDRYYS